MKKPGSSKSDPPGHAWEEAFEKAYIKYFPNLLRFARYRLCNGCEETACDLVQNTFKNVYTRSVDLTQVTNQWGFLLTMMRHLRIDDVRKVDPLSKASSIEEKTEDDQEKFLLPVQPDALRKVENYDLLRRLGKAAKDFEPQQKNLLVLHLQGYNCLEISEITHLDVGVVEHDLNLLKQVLKHRLKDKSKKGRQGKDKNN